MQILLAFSLSLNMLPAFGEADDLHRYVWIGILKLAHVWEATAELRAQQLGTSGWDE